MVLSVSTEQIITWRKKGLLVFLTCKVTGITSFSVEYFQNGHEKTKEKRESDKIDRISPLEFTIKIPKV